MSMKVIRLPHRGGVSRHVQMVRVYAAHNEEEANMPSLPAAIHISRHTHLDVVEEGVAIGLELLGELGPATANDAALRHDVHIVGLDVVE